MVLAEKGTLDHAKDVFARVREVSAEVLGDVWINLAHVYLAQNKHNEVSFNDQHFCRENNVGGSVVDKLVAHHVYTMLCSAASLVTPFFLCVKPIL